MIDAAKIEELRGLLEQAIGGLEEGCLPCAHCGHDEPTGDMDVLYELRAMHRIVTTALAASLASAGEDAELCSFLDEMAELNRRSAQEATTELGAAYYTSLATHLERSATRIRALASEKEGLRRETGRQCVNCGRWFPKEWDRAKAPDDCKSPDACTIDMTADEAWQHWRKEAHTERARAESSEALVAELREKVERLTKALLRLQNGAAVALNVIPEDQQEGVVGNFLAAIHRECCAGLSAGQGADECEDSTP